MCMCYLTTYNIRCTMVSAKRAAQKNCPHNHSLGYSLWDIQTAHCCADCVRICEYVCILVPVYACVDIADGKGGVQGSLDDA